MKFFTDSITRCAARIGTLNGFQRMPNVSFETPTSYLHKGMKYIIFYNIYIILFILLK